MLDRDRDRETTHWSVSRKQEKAETKGKKWTKRDMRVFCCFVASCYYLRRHHHHFHSFLNAAISIAAVFHLQALRKTSCGLFLAVCAAWRRRLFVSAMEAMEAKQQRRGCCCFAAVVCDFYSFQFAV